MPLSREDLRKMGRVSFDSLQEAEVFVDFGALSSLPRRNWHLLQTLKLTVIWNCHEYSTRQFNSFWRSFSKAKNNWPRLENLELRLYRATPGLIEYHHFEDDDENDDDLRPDTGHALACILPNLPKLKHLKITSRLAVKDLQALAALPATTMENMDLTASLVLQNYPV